MKKRLKDAVLLKEKSQMLCTSKITYRLERFAGEYLVTVQYQEEQAEESLGICRRSAINCFEKLVAGSVTPCTLENIVADWKSQAQI